jgi:hypothetical protein
LERQVRSLGFNRSLESDAVVIIKERCRCIAEVTVTKIGGAD